MRVPQGEFIRCGSASRPLPCRTSDRSPPWRDDDQSSLAGIGRSAVRPVAARVVALIRVDAIWLAVEPLDMRAGTETILARVVKVFGAARPPRLPVCQ